MRIYHNELLFKFKYINLILPIFIINQKLKHTSKLIVTSKQYENEYVEFNKIFR